MRITSDLGFSREQAGAVFDLPAAMAKELLSMKIESGEVIEPLEKVHVKFMGCIFCSWI